MVQLEQCAAVGKRWQIGPYRFEHQPNGKWGCEANGQGIGDQSTPVGALWALHRHVPIGSVVLSVAHRRIPSWRREQGGSYDLYVAIHSRVYGWRMRSLHHRGRHGRTNGNALCSWCGGKVPGARVTAI